MKSNFVFALTIVALAAVPSVARADEQPNTVTLHVRNAPADLVVQRWDGDWDTVCVGACDRPVEIDATYRMNGPHVRASKTFHVDGKPGDTVTVDFDGKSSAAFAAGIALTATGGIFLTLAALSGAFAVWALSSGDGMGALVGGAFYGAVSGGALTIGLATLIPGIVLIAKNGPSNVRPEGLPAPSMPAREAVLRDAHATVPTPRFVSIPIFAGTF